MTVSKNFKNKILFFLFIQQDKFALMSCHVNKIKNINKIQKTI